jgi:uncharacterized protein YerC
MSESNSDQGRPKVVQERPHLSQAASLSLAELLWRHVPYKALARELGVSESTARRVRRAADEKLARYNDRIQRRLETLLEELAEAEARSRTLRSGRR